MLGFDITSNPVADVATLPEYSQPSHRALSEAELRALWRLLTATETPSAVSLRLSLLLGGHRIAEPPGCAAA